jgi:hypothetical protein
MLQDEECVGESLILELYVNLSYLKKAVKCAELHTRIACNYLHLWVNMQETETEA